VNARLEKNSGPKKVEIYSPGVDVMLTIFSYFRQFSPKNYGEFLKKQSYAIFSALIAIFQK
jgi:hypothetical protein